MVKCRKCNGTGKITCPACLGEKDIKEKKKIKINLKSIQAYNFNTERICLYCYGKGEVDCDRCNGTGTVNFLQ